MDMQGLPGFQGLPGMTLSLSIGEVEELEIDLALIEDVITLEFGVLTDCGNAVGGTVPSNGHGLMVFPNPTGADAVVRLDPAWSAGRDARWFLVDAVGRVVDAGKVQEGTWRLPLSGRPSGGYLLVVESGVDVLRKRVMVAR